MTTVIDLDAVERHAAAYAYADFREGIKHQMWIELATGADMDTARRRAFRLADKERRGERGCTSLDGLLETHGDALRVAGLPAPSLDKHQRRRDGQATERQPEKGIEGLDEGTLDYLVAVLRNLFSRIGAGDDPLTCAIDVGSMEPVIRRALLAMFQGATWAELGEAGIRWRDRRRARRELKRYALIGSV